MGETYQIEVWRLETTINPFSHMTPSEEYKCGSERESGETCILRGFLKGSYFRSAGPPKQQILARMADKPGSRCGNGAPRAERWNVSHNGSARPRSLETRKGRGFPHSHSDGDCGCQIGQTAKTRVNHAFFQILVQNRKSGEVVCFDMK